MGLFLNSQSPKYLLFYHIFVIYSCYLIKWLMLYGHFCLVCVCPYLHLVVFVVLVSSYRLCPSFPLYSVLEFFNGWRILIKRHWFSLECYMVYAIVQVNGSFQLKEQIVYYMRTGEIMYIGIYVYKTYFKNTKHNIIVYERNIG